MSDLTLSIGVNVIAIDYLKGAATCTGFILITMVWMHCSDQKAVARSLPSSLAVIARIIAVHVVVMAIWCFIFALPIDY